MEVYDTFPLRNGIHFGDSIEEVKQKEKLPDWKETKMCDPIKYKNFTNRPDDRSDLLLVYPNPLTVRGIDIQYGYCGIVPESNENSLLYFGEAANISNCWVQYLFDNGKKLVRLRYKYCSCKFYDEYLNKDFKNDWAFKLYGDLLNSLKTKYGNPTYTSFNSIEALIQKEQVKTLKEETYSRLITAEFWPKEYEFVKGQELKFINEDLRNCSFFDRTLWEIETDNGMVIVVLERRNVTSTGHYYSDYHSGDYYVDINYSFYPSDKYLKIKNNIINSVNAEKDAEKQTEAEQFNRLMSEL